MNAPLDYGPVLLFPLAEDWSPPMPRTRIQPPSPELKQLAATVASRYPRKQLSDAEVDAWAAALAEDVAGAND